MRRLLLFLFFNCCLMASPQAQQLTTLFETSNGRESPDYFQIIKWWQQLDRASVKVSMHTMGATDAGYPLHLVTIGNAPGNRFQQAHLQNKVVILINNGIHAGEPDGIDASMLLARDIVEKKIILPENIVLAIIPVYNVGGVLNRSRYYRVDQGGPLYKGSRVNSRGLDLNRDFIKCDSKEALSFADIFHRADPDIFLDNHVSNGADYQHIITLLTTQYNKLGGAMGDYLHQKFEPEIYNLMKKEGYDLIPYVNYFGKNLNQGWTGFWDSPRYASGYASLFHSFAFVPETHMLKPYKERVAATYALMKSFISFGSKNNEAIKKLRKEAKKDVATAEKFPIAFQLDSTQQGLIEFKGYKATYKKSKVSGLARLYYDRAQPFSMQIPFYNYYYPTLYISKPKAYILPQGWWPVVDRLKANHVQMRQLTRDSVIKVETYYITSYQSAPWPYQTHHLNSKVKTETREEERTYLKGDYWIPLNQAANRFLIETLEPQCEDSYFAWNFFDGILNAREWYSNYNYEDIAAQYLEENPQLKKELEKKQATDTVFANNADAQLTFIFNASPYKDRDFMRYPVGRAL